MVGLGREYILEPVISKESIAFSTRQNDNHKVTDILMEACLLDRSSFQNQSMLVRPEAAKITDLKMKMKFRLSQSAFLDFLYRNFELIFLNPKPPVGSCRTVSTLNVFFGPDKNYIFSITV